MEQQALLPVVAEAREVAARVALQVIPQFMLHLAAMAEHTVLVAGREE